MIRNIDLSKPKTQFYLGLLLNFLFLIILYSFETSFTNTQSPTGIYKSNIWACGDVITYIEPGINFTKHGVFGHNTTPDHFRTIGYPAIISFFYAIFGGNWILPFQIFQSIIFAFIYPLITATIKILLPNSNERLIKMVFIVLCISGAYFTRSLVVLTDMLFTLLFIAGFYYSLQAYITKKYKHLILYFIFISIASLVRPTLTLFPLLNLIVGYWVAKKYTYPIKRTLFKSFYISIALFCLINISTLRNYFNYSFSSPSSVIALNAFEYLSKKVLIMEGKTNKYDLYKENLDKVENIVTKTKMQKKIMYKTVTEYPISTCKVLFTNTINLFFSNNLISNISNYYGYEWKKFKSTCYPFKTSNILKICTYAFMVFYFILWCLFFLKLINLLKNKDYETFSILTFLFIMFMVPAILTGDGGGRFRLPFEHILFIFGFSMISTKNNLFQNIKNRIVKFF